MFDIFLIIEVYWLSVVEIPGNLKLCTLNVESIFVCQKLLQYVNQIVDGSMKKFTKIVNIADHNRVS